MLPLVDRDEPRFAEASREMIERGDYVVPYFNDRYRFDKPPLTYWAQVASYRVFGQNPFAARLPERAGGGPDRGRSFRLGPPARPRARRFLGGDHFHPLPADFCPCQGRGGRYVAGPFHDHWRTGPVTSCCATVSAARWRSVVLKPDGLRGWWWMFYLSLALAFLAKGPIGLMPLGTVMVFQSLAAGAAFWRPVSFR